MRTDAGVVPLFFPCCAAAGFLFPLPAGRCWKIDQCGQSGQRLKQEASHNHLSHRVEEQGLG